MEPPLLKAGDVAKLLGLGRSKVFAMLAVGELPVIRIGRSVRVPRAALEDWIAEHTQHASGRTGDAGPLFVGESGQVRPHVGTSAREPRSFSIAMARGRKKDLQFRQ
jgi:excisionase family DNA binding protein